MMNGYSMRHKIGSDTLQRRTNWDWDFDRMALDTAADTVRSTMLGTDSPVERPSSTDLTNAIQRVGGSNNPQFTSDLETVTQQTAKAYGGWKKDTNGNWVQDTTAKTHADQIDRLKKGPELSGWDKLNIGIFTNKNDRQAILDPAEKGVEKGIKKSITWDRILSDPRGYFKLWADQNGHKGLSQFANNPTLFWGTLLAGGVGIAGLVSAFIGAFRGGGNVVNNYYYGNTAVPQSQVPPATTSFWRA